MINRRIAPALLAALLTLGACGGGSDDGESVVAPSTPERGDPIDGAPAKLASYSPANLLALLTDNEIGQVVLQAITTPTCTIDVHQLKYQTVDPAGNITAASGALMVPNGPDAACQGPRPVLLYGHGTNTDRSYNIADLENADNAEGLMLAAVFAADGYIVVAPNYLGYDSSTLDYHPYLNGDQQSKDMIDALAAARSALPTASASSTTDDGRLFVTGYSQGGYVAMATHKAMQAAGMTVTASGPMSGPYALSAFGDAIFQGQVSASAPVNLTLLLSSYQRSYGNLYTNAADAFEGKYANDIEGLLPSTESVPDLEAQGKLPAEALFNSTPPDVAYASMTPATAPPELAPVFAIGFGSDPLLTNSFRLAYLQDSQANPDGGFPSITDGLPPANPQHPLRQALKLNDQRSWTPTAPMLLCAGSLDPTVLYLNTQLMQSYWADAPGVTVLDVDSSASGADPYEDLKQRFSLVKSLVRANAIASGASDGGDRAVFEVYHAGLVGPFCLSAVKSFFDAQ